MKNLKKLPDIGGEHGLTAYEEARSRLNENFRLYRGARAGQILGVDGIIDFGLGELMLLEPSKANFALTLVLKEGALTVQEKVRFTEDELEYIEDLRGIIAKGWGQYFMLPGMEQLDQDSLRRVENSNKIIKDYMIAKVQYYKFCLEDLSEFIKMKMKYECDTRGLTKGQQNAVRNLLKESPQSLSVILPNSETLDCFARMTPEQQRVVKGYAKVEPFIKGAMTTERLSRFVNADISKTGEIYKKLQEWRAEAGVDVVRAVPVHNKLLGSIHSHFLRGLRGLHEGKMRELLFIDGAKEKYSKKDGTILHIMCNADNWILNERNTKEKFTNVAEKFIEEGGFEWDKKEYDYGYTALHFAAAHDNIAVFRALVNQGASLAVENNIKKTPLECVPVSSKHKGEFKEFIPQLSDDLVEKCSNHFLNMEVKAMPDRKLKTEDEIIDDRIESFLSQFDVTNSVSPAKEALADGKAGAPRTEAEVKELDAKTDAERLHRVADSKAVDRGARKSAFTGMIALTASAKAAKPVTTKRKEGSVFASLKNNIEARGDGAAKPGGGGVGR